MIGYLRGKILSAENGHALIDIDGVGYEVSVPARIAQALIPGAQIELHIHTHVREDALELFGFETAWEKRVYMALVSVSGVGPRTALGVMGMHEPRTLLEAIVSEDKGVLLATPGVGKKTAERLIVELRDKADKLLLEAGFVTAASPAKKGEKIPAQGATSARGVMSEAVAALTGLGYKEHDAWATVRETVLETGEDVVLQVLIRKSLQKAAVR